MALKDYSELPDFMSTPEIESEVAALLRLAPAEDPVDVAEAMFELVHRSGQNADPLSTEIANSIDVWFCAVWSPDGDALLVDILLSVVVNLPLPRALARVRGTEKVAPGENAKLIREALNELDR